MSKRKYKLKVSVKKRLLMIAGCSCFLAVAFIIGSMIFSNDNKSNTKQSVENGNIENKENDITPIEKEDANNIDILAIGNSDLYSAFNPLQLWNEQGYTSFVAAAPKQNMKLSYYMLKEALTVQKPKLLILETDAFFDNREKSDDESYSYIAMKYSYPLFMKSKRWNEIKNESYTADKNFQERMEILKGYYYQTTVVANKKGFSYMSKNDARQDFPSYTKEYLPKIIDLAKENHCQILFICYPSETSWNYVKSNTVNDFAVKNDIPFLDFNTQEYETAFDWNTDSRDGGNHLNYSGAKKLTKYIGNYIQKHFGFKNHQHNSDYNQWNIDYKTFKKKTPKK